jgi:hypothetical protein
MNDIIMRADLSERKMDDKNFWIRALPGGRKEFYSKIYYDKNFERRENKIVEQIEKLLNETET